MLSYIKNRLTDREDSEHGQCYVKFTMGTAWLLYVLWVNNNLTLLPPEALVSPVIFLLMSLVVFSWIIIIPKPYPFRRYFGMIFDAFLISYALYFLNEHGTPLIGAYLFITFGYGFRYGNKYLFSCMLLSIIGFSFVIKFGEFWHTQKLLSYGFLMTIIILTIYVSKLISQLHKAVNEAKSANDAKSQFLANMSHEIRTPLNGVIGMSALLSKTQLSSKQKDFSSTINASAKTLLVLINDILDISKIEAGKIIIETTDFDLHALINSITIMLSPQAREKGLAFNVHISSEIPFLLRSDEQHIRQILINLIGNAIKFTKEGVIEIYVSQISATNTHVTIKIEIVDTGIGIPEKEKAKLFDKFTQADESTTRKFGGTGLGMAIAKQLVESMNGRIDFSSKYGEGSNFWFELDLEKQLVVSEEKNSMVRFNDTTILLVNSHKDYSQTIENHLSLWPIKYEYEYDAQSALNIISSNNIKNKPFNIVLVFQKYLDIDPVKFITLVNTQSYHNNSFILINDEQLSDTKRSEVFSSGYSTIIDSTPNRTQLFRALHALVAGTDIASSNENTNNKENYLIRDIDNRRLKILVGEDNETNRNVIKNILEYGNHEITLAENGEIVLNFLENHDFDLIILDMHMPVMGGIEAAKIFRFMYPYKKHIPIIMLTANATTDAINASKEANLDAFLTKPVDPDKLLGTISLLIKNKESDDASGTKSQLKIVNINEPENMSLIEIDALESLFKMAKEENFMRNLIDSYLRDAKINIDKIKVSISKSEHQKITDAAHALDGSSRSIGAKRLSIMADKIFKLSKSKQYNLVEELMEELNNIYNETKVALESFIKHKKSASL